MSPYKWLLCHLYPWVLLSSTHIYFERHFWVELRFISTESVLTLLHFIYTEHLRNCLLSWVPRLQYKGKWRYKVKSGWVSLCLSPYNFFLLYKRSLDILNFDFILICLFTWCVCGDRQTDRHTDYEILTASDTNINAGNIILGCLLWGKDT